jgi:hypothetical protein
LGIFNYFKKDDTPLWKDLMRILELIRVEQARMTKDIENLQLKARGKGAKTPEEEEPPQEKTDGFDSIRKLAKDIKK